MKKIRHLLVLTALACCLFGCSPLDLDFKDPENFQSIQDEFSSQIDQALTENNDLVELFGEENIHWGPVPPTWKDSICFKVDGMDYDTCVRYIYAPSYPNTTLSHAIPPDFNPSINVHLFYDQNQGVFKHEMKTRDPYANYYFLDLEKAYMIGHDSLFTTYYQGKTIGNGNPTIIMLISGTLVFDKNNGEFVGVREYILGKKILSYETQPSQAYAHGTIEIMRHDSLSPKCSWDDL